MLGIVEFLLRRLWEITKSFKVPLGPALLIALLPVLVLQHERWEHFLPGPLLTMMPWIDEYETKYGYYRVLGPNQQDCSKETLHITTYSNGNILARSEGNPWEYDGVHESYRTRAGSDYSTRFLMYRVDTPRPPLAGTVYLFPKRKSGRGVVAGEWVGVSSNARAVYRCPYLLSDYQLGTGESCDSQWPSVFGPLDAESTGEAGDGQGAAGCERLSEAELEIVNRR